MGWNWGRVRVLVWGLRGQESRVKSGALLEAPPALLMLRRCSQRSETTSQQQALALPPHPTPSLSPSLSASSLWRTKGLLGGRDSRVDGSREQHGILMVVERVREERRCRGWMVVEAERNPAPPSSLPSSPSSHTHTHTNMYVHKHASTAASL